MSVCFVVFTMLHGAAEGGIMSLTMAKKTPKTGSAPDVNPKPDQGYNPVIGFRVPPEMRAIIEDLADEERRKLSQMIAILVEDALVARGKWPVKSRKPKE